VVLVKKKASDGTDQRLAVKVLKKSHIISCCSVTYTVTEKKALVLASGHPFITTLYSCFQTKVIFNFLNLLHISSVINTEIYHQFENVMFRCICKIAKMDYELHYVCLAVHLSVCPCGTTQLPLDTFSLKSSVSNLMRIFRKSVKIIGVSLKCDKNS